MKQISELEEKPFTSSLNNIGPLQKPSLLYKGVGTGGVPYSPDGSVVVSFKDDQMTLLVVL
jgi:hypothetical protein